MSRTAELSRKIFDYIKGHIKPGISEIEFSGMYEAYGRKMGHGAQLRVRDYQTEGYSWHILSGVSGGMVGLLDSPASGEGTSVAFPCGAGNKLLEKNEPIMIDLSIVQDGYHADETRMFAIGRMPQKAMDGSLASIEIYQAILDRVKPGRTIDDLYQTSIARAKSLGYEHEYLGPPGYKVSFIGHGIGLELVEPLIIARGKRDILRPGMIFALEPKMVFKDQFTVGVESAFLVTEKGHRVLSHVPFEIFIC
jgi:Xaa-Pro aminopeptidase